MTRTAETVDELRDELDSFVEAIPVGAPPALAEAIRGLMAAVDYKDPALAQSHLESMKEAIAETADAEVERLLHRAARARDLCDQVRTLDVTPGPELDGLGQSLGQRFNQELEAIARLRATWIDLAKDHGASLRRAAELDAAERQLADLKQSVLGTWPWSSGGLPPVDREMVSRSREARGRGEGQSIDEAIRQVAGTGPAT